jgi:hypothetical protein
VGEEFLGQRKLVTAHAVVGNQQPPAGVLLGGVGAVADHVLGDLDDDRLGVSVQRAVQRAITDQGLSKVVSAESGGQSGNLLRGVLLSSALAR